MDRKEAILKFREEEKEKIEACRQLLYNDLAGSAEKLTDIVIESLKQVGQEIKAINKEYNMFYYFSLLKIDVLQRKYTVMLQSQDIEWYLDKDELTNTFQIDFLFQPLNELWDKLLTESKKYIGLINQYDVQEIIFEELTMFNGLIAHTLRFTLRELEHMEFFQEIHKPHIWEIRWGEYRDESEVILRVDQEQKPEREWKLEAAKAKRGKDNLIYSYWYQGRYSGSDCSKNDMMFIHFDHCKLSNMTFDHANMLGADFRGTQLEQCSFLECDLQDSDFLGTRFLEVDFTGANLTNAVFDEEILTGLNLSVDQLKSILVEKER